jgi:dolichol-phosphate mannosyltransferase
MIDRYEEGGMPLKRDSNERKDTSPDLSIVVPAYNEEGNIERLYSEIKSVLSSLEVSWEIVFCDDGSKDNTWENIEKLNSVDTRVCGLRLSRNFGHQNALLAGLRYAKGDAVISMDADMQHPPEIIPTLLDKWREGYKIVKTIRVNEKEVTFLKRTSSRLYYRLFSYLSGVEIENGMADFRLLDRQVLSDILKFREDGLFLRGIVQWVGYPSASVSFECGSRYSGTTKYTLGKMLRLAWDGVSSFSLVPLRLTVLIGLLSCGVAFLGILYAILSKWLIEGAVPGWASSLAIISFLFATLFLFLAILAEYVGRILVEVRDRPRFLVSQELNSSYSGNTLESKNINT